MVDLPEDKRLGALILANASETICKARSEESADAHSLQESSFFTRVLATTSWEAPPPGFDSLLSEVSGENAEQIFSTQLSHTSRGPEAHAQALLNTILAEAAYASDPTVFFHYWLSETVRRWLSPRGFLHEGASEELTALRQRIQDMITLGINLRGRSPADFLAARFELAPNYEGVEKGPGCILDLIVSSASFAGAGVLETLNVLSLSPPSPYLASVTFGRLAGTFYGQERLWALSTFGAPFGEFFTTNQEGGS